MEVVFDPALTKLMNKEGFSPRDPRLFKPSIQELISQLGGSWNGFQSLNNPRKRALRQLWARLSRKNEQESRMSLFLGADVSDSDLRRVSNITRNCMPIPLPF